MLLSRSPNKLEASYDEADKAVKALAAHLDALQKRESDPKVGTKLQAAGRPREAKKHAGETECDRQSNQGTQSRRGDHPRTLNRRSRARRHDTRRNVGQAFSLRRASRPPSPGVIGFNPL